MVATEFEQGASIDPTPFRVLGLRPGAPRDLVDEAYWHLTQDANQTLGDVAVITRLAALNAAYDTIVHMAAQERAAATSLPPRALAQRRRLWVLNNTKPDAGIDLDADYYDVLKVDVGASQALVQLAATILLPSAGRDPGQHALIMKARDTLTDPELRAEYDARRGILHGDDRAVASSANGSAPAAEAFEPAPELVVPATADVDTAPADAGDEEVAGEVPSAEARQAEASSGQVVPVGEPAPMTHAVAEAPEAQPSRVVETAVRVEPVTLVDSTAEAAPRKQELLPEPAVDPAEDDKKATPRRRLSKLGGLLRRDEAVEDPEVEAENTRVLALRNETRPVRSAPRPPIDEAPAASPPISAIANGDVGLLFVGGPRAGEAVPLDAIHDLGIDLSADDAEGAPVRIWRGRGKFLFQQLDGPTVRISGEEVVFPVVVLEDGDEIQSGSHVLKFSEPQ